MRSDFAARIVDAAVGNRGWGAVSAMLELFCADVAELVDATDLKSVEGDLVRVRVPPSAPPIDSKAI